ncbi:hypothetical protein DCS_00719 [Drechmeria coniospora]|uniref:Probable glucan endo-1,3-beta-glucosidase eglC n=1 Tax=Drechmeria coniospora TaxID=98403 RepID=A0A151GR51_DRECN|nr:hypothetical protein DCS_00719 [Drechmeria coniospora]KYK59587.1 hypothetical protein DCS_00719 [Drechmeria coniospora]ODA76723.1 hypothetical protein RJ55_07994 [Drechmeria coniospora]
MPPSPSRLLLAAAVAATSTSAAFQGFNYASSFNDGKAKSQSDFESEFKTAAGLQGTNGSFNSARLYTMVQGSTANEPISAIPAAISTKTSLLLGIWASAGESVFLNELAAVEKTIKQYCGALDGLVAGISVGSEDLYRISPIGMENSPDPGASPDTLVSYIEQVRKTVKGTCLDVPIGHVDTWTAYVNGSNKAVIDAADWLGMDAYPYYEVTKPNGIENAKSLFQAALDRTKDAAGGKPVWVTETGWPLSGETAGEAVPSIENAKTFWDDVGCPMFGETNVWWFTLQEGSPPSPKAAFGVIGSQLTTVPLFDLSCDKVKTETSSSSTTATSSSTTGSSSQTETANVTATTHGSLSDTKSASASSVTYTDGSGSSSPVSTSSATAASTSALPTGVTAIKGDSTASSAALQSLSTSIGNRGSSGVSVARASTSTSQSTSIAAATDNQPTSAPSLEGAAGRLNPVGTAVVALALVLAVAIV